MGEGVQSVAFPSLFMENNRRVAQLVEHRSPKPAVAGSSPASPATENDVLRRD